MKISITATLLTFTFVCSNVLFGNVHFNQKSQVNFSDICENTYDFELKGNVNPITAKQITDYILNKTGICDVKIDVYSKKITIYSTKEIDLESIKGLIRYASHHFLLEENHKETIEK
jgi:hypothetical protein